MNFTMPLIILGTTHFKGDIDGGSVNSHKIDCLGSEYDPTDNKSSASAENIKFGFMTNKYNINSEVFHLLRMHNHFPVQVTANCSINKNNQLEVKSISADFVDLKIGIPKETAAIKAS